MNLTTISLNRRIDHSLGIYRIADVCKHKLESSIIKLLVLVGLLHIRTYNIVTLDIKNNNKPSTTKFHNRLHTKTLKP